MLLNLRAAIIAACFCIAFFAVVAQDQGQLNGNFEITAQTYNKDSIIGAPIVPEKSGANAFLNLIYTKGKFTSGIRLEGYTPPLQGFDPRFGTKRIGLPYRFVMYQAEGLEFTVGNFYEQFGNGMILRAYEERGLGLDNAFDGVRVKYEPTKGLYLKALIGEQRFYWEKSDGYVRAFDAEASINEMIPSMEESPLRLSIGGSFVSKFQSAGISTLELPENVGSWAGRLQANYKDFGFVAEYVYKMNDPSADNDRIYRPGQGLLLTGTYSTKGFGITLSAKSIDNMAYRSDRTALINDLFINYLPALTRQHTYSLAATLYPYATQPNGEVAFQGDLIYKIPKGSALGGKYGITIQANASFANSLDTTQLSSKTELDAEAFLPNDPGRKGYTANMFGIGKKVYYRDYNLEIDKKFNKSFKLKATYVHLEYNIDQIQGTATGQNVVSDIGIIDMLFKISRKHSIRTELQGLVTEQDQGDWAFALIEYGYSPHWFITVLDQYNIGNPNEALRIHYPTVQVVYIQHANRISLGYGRQREGIFCVGGVCRNVPAANGLTLSITSSF